MKKRLPIGISDFKILREGDFAYVDKSLLIQEILEKGSTVSLIPRMRRFGKTLNLSMLRYFFEKNEEDTSHLFQGLKIWQDEKARSFQGKFPVIFLTLKDIKQATWEESQLALRRLIADEFERHQKLLEDEILTEREKELFRRILTDDEDLTLYEQSLFYLSGWLERAYSERVILLIDEYDTPAHAAYVGGYYDQMISFLRNWLSGGLKDNRSLEKGVLTGILRLAKESIFSGLNNISTYSLLNESFKDKFGLLEREVLTLLKDYGLEEKGQEVRRWYNGYRVGSQAGIYNPWSVLKWIEEGGVFTPYWVNTSDNALMKHLITQGSGALKGDVEKLLNQEAVEKNLEEGIVLTALQETPSALWSLLLFSGYLTLKGNYHYGHPTSLGIPNLEVRELYKAIIQEWFFKTLHEENYRLLLQSLVKGDTDTFLQIFQDFLLSSVSVFDVAAEEPEKIYHAFVLGMLVGLQGRYEVKSNRESGYGRYDVMLIPKNSDELGIVLEFKKARAQESLEQAATQALSQIEEMQYQRELVQRGIQRTLWLALAFKGKRVEMKTKVIQV